ncbi:Rrf2 family transcriptional regulator [Altererythrobacter sp. CC-YST694]|uniref:RrF2 family transcriptional regulator n=1 Tax=Altererythrobacter sp. CC-YST694 TaxID=2755038 RepID=UPI001D01624C|nr:Rrf2 family transcriptional regulator [Altererythrobacter sp. CC-YST694]MCB5423926.1 Rrf2 family transcriptional regulator [Altererythrobacter sp. CC-YST694]
MISNKAKYAFRALLAIASQPEGEALTSAEIARTHSIPHKFLEQILLDLKKAGILDSRRGKSGGYVMLRPADTVSFGEVLRLFEGPLAPLPCLSRNAYRRCEDCVSEAACEIRREFGRAYDASRQVLDSRTLADALHNNPYGVEPGHEVRRAG